MFSNMFNVTCLKGFYSEYSFDFAFKIQILKSWLDVISRNFKTHKTEFAMGFTIKASTIIAANIVGTSRRVSDNEWGISGRRKL